MENGNIATIAWQAPVIVHGAVMPGFLEVGSTISFLGRDTSPFRRAAFPVSGLGNRRTRMVHVDEIIRDFGGNRAPLRKRNVAIPCHQGISPQSSAGALIRRPEHLS